MHRLTIFSAFISLLLSGAIFGFFYAWVCSTMWGLDTLAPNTAIAAMQAMNASVRNAVFMPAFFLTPVAMFVTAVLAYKTRTKTAALAFGLGGVIYLFGGLILTAAVNVPMNEVLGLVQLPLPEDEARAIWSAYSVKWQVYNQTRTLFSGIALLFTGWGIWSLARRA